MAEARAAVKAVGTVVVREEEMEAGTAVTKAVARAMATVAVRAGGKAAAMAVETVVAMVGVAMVAETAVVRARDLKVYAAAGWLVCPGLGLQEHPQTILQDWQGAPNLGLGLLPKCQRRDWWALHFHDVCCCSEPQMQRVQREDCCPLLRDHAQWMSKQLVGRYRCRRGDARSVQYHWRSQAHRSMFLRAQRGWRRQPFAVQQEENVC